MGAYLSQPVKDKEVDSGETDLVKYSCAAMQGWRTEMEDAHVAATCLPHDTDVFGVFDGHGGKEVAKFVAIHFAAELQKSDGFKKSDLSDVLKKTFLSMDELMLLEKSQQQLMELAGDRNEDENIEVSDLEEIPEFLRNAILASQKPGGQQAGQANQIPKEVRSFPIDVQIEEHDDEDDDDDGSDKEGGDEEDGEGKEDMETNHVEDMVEGPTGEVPTSKRRRGDGEPSQSLASNGSHDVPVNGVPGSTGNNETSEGTAPGSAMTEEAVGDVESPRTPENRIVGAPDGRLRELGGPLAGCTAVVAAIRGTHLFVANAGDSRCVLSRNGKAVPMSYDHKPTDPNEESRIRKAGGFVREGRVNGSLNLSRALGDMEYKRSRNLPPEQQMVTAMPDVMDVMLEKGDDFLILACDGIWDVLDHQESVDFVIQRLKESKDPETICQEMCDHCLADDTEGSGEGCDNMTAMVVLLKKFTNLDISNLSKGDESTSAS